MARRIAIASARQRNDQHQARHTPTPQSRPGQSWLQRTLGNQAYGQLVRPDNAAIVPAAVYQALRGAGHPLDPATRAFMESRLGHDFGQVRVHTDARAAASADAVQARAYTVGPDVAFAAGAYAPGTAEGRRLLAHELTHVVQQRAAGHPHGRPGENAAGSQANLRIGEPGDIDERHADHVAQQVTQAPARVGFWNAVQPPTAPRSTLQRQQTELEVSSPQQREPVPITLPEVSAQSADPRSRADYVDRRLLAVGYGIHFGGYVLELAGVTELVFVPESHFDFTAANMMPVDLVIYPTRDSALEKVPYGPWAPNQAQPYAYYSGVNGLIAPTMFTPATTPRIIDTALRAQQELGEQISGDLISLAGGMLLGAIIGRLLRAGGGRPKARKQPPRKAGEPAVQETPSETGPGATGDIVAAGGRAESSYLNLFRQLRSGAVGQGAELVTEGVAMAGIQVSVRSGRLLARYTHIENIGRNTGFGRMAQQAFERAAAAAAREAGASTAQVAVELVGNPNWANYLKEEGYSPQYIPTGRGPGGHELGINAWTKIINP